MDKILKLNYGLTTVKDLKNFLADIPDDTKLYPYALGDGGMESITLSYQYGDLDIDVETYNTIY